MTIEQLRKVYDAQPFQPFTVHLADGRSFSVPHRDFISHHPKGRTLIIYGESKGDFNILDLLLVTGIEVNVSNANFEKGGSNGSS